jgi:hypothetical protein
MMSVEDKPTLTEILVDLDFISEDDVGLIKSARANESWNSFIERHLVENRVLTRTQMDIALSIYKGLCSESLAERSRHRVRMVQVRSKRTDQRRQTLADVQRSVVEKSEAAQRRVQSGQYPTVGELLANKK